jgi:hypothetical protein
MYLIEAIWIIERSSGICIYEQTYEEIESTDISTDLISGLFSAFVDITKQFFKQCVDYIKLRNSRVYFTITSELIFIVKFEEDFLLDEEIEEIMFNIVDAFICEFQETLLHWNGNLKAFEGFTFILNEIIGILPFYAYFN